MTHIHLPLNAYLSMLVVLSATWSMGRLMSDSEARGFYGADQRDLLASCSLLRPEGR